MESKKRIKKKIDNYPLFINGIYAEHIIDVLIHRLFLRELQIKISIQSAKWSEAYIEHESGFQEGKSINQTISKYLWGMSLTKEDVPWFVRDYVEYKRNILEKYGERGWRFWKFHLQTGIKTDFSLINNEEHWEWLRYSKQVFKVWKNKRLSQILPLRKKLKLPKLIYSMAEKRIHLSGVILKTDFN